MGCLNKTQEKGDALNKEMEGEGCKQTQRRGCANKTQ